jgi:hypothetical protein
VIRNVCIHVSNEQPLMCDLFELPSADDAGLLCTNVRSMDGKRPVFIDHIGSTFFFPYHVVRFLEIPEPEMAAYRASGGRAPAVGLGDGGGASPWDDRTDEADGSGEYADPGSMLPIAVGAPADPGADDPDADLEIDEDFLQRVRDI